MVGISLLPLMIDTINTFIPVGRLVHVYVSRVLVTLLTVQYVIALFYFFAMVIPFYMEPSEIITREEYISIRPSYDWTHIFIEYSSWTSTAWLAVILGTLCALWLWFNAVYCYIQTILHSPTRRGKVHPKSEKKGEKPATPILDEKGRKLCTECQKFKDPGTHHCSQCGMCIPNMDHHCPFTANCISTGPAGNFTYFFLFIFYTAAGSLFVTLTMSFPFYHCWFLREISVRCIPVGRMALIILPAVCLFTATAAFTCLHVFLIYFGQSTLQFLQWLEGHHSEATSNPLQSPSSESPSKPLVSKLHCSPCQFLLPFLIRVQTPKADKSD